MKRITIQSILEHDWLKDHLIEKLFPPLGEINTAEIDASVVSEVCQKLKVPAADIMAAIK